MAEKYIKVEGNVKDVIFDDNGKKLLEFDKETGWIKYLGEEPADIQIEAVFVLD